MNAIAIEPKAEAEKLAEVEQEAADVISHAESIVITTDEEAGYATGFLAEIQAAKRKGETARRFLVDPLNAHVKAINERFKGAAVPLDEADQIVRKKVLDYQTEQQRKQAEIQERLERERREAEEAASAEQQRKAEEARQAEREAAEAEQRRQEEMAAQQDEQRRLIAAMDEDSLKAVLANEHSHDDEIRMAMEELASRRETREANERAAKARQEAEEAEQRSIAVQSAPEPAVASVTPLRSAKGAASVRTEWKATAVIDKSQVPDEFLVVDMAAVQRQVRAGRHEIPGIKIEQVQGLAVRGGGR